MYRSMNITPLTVVVSALPLSTNTKTKKVCCLLMLLLGSVSVSYAKDYADAMTLTTTAPEVLCDGGEEIGEFTIPSFNGSFEGGFIVDTDAKTVSYPGSPEIGTYTSISESVNNSKHYYGFLSIPVPSFSQGIPYIATFKGSFVSTRLGRELVGNYEVLTGECPSRINSQNGKLVNPINATTLTKTESDLLEAGTIYYIAKFVKYIRSLNEGKSKNVKLIKKETVSGVRG